MSYWPCLAALILARAADLGSTYAITPSLRRELNPLIRRMGWRATIALNALLCPFLAFSEPIAMIVAFGSVFLAVMNCLTAFMFFHGAPWGICGLLAGALLGLTLLFVPTAAIGYAMLGVGIAAVLWMAWVCLAVLRNP